MQTTLAVVLAGGRGSRLDPLTRDRAKPAVPVGGAYRIVDFVLSNCVNSGLRRVLVLTQYKGQSLDRHIGTAWQRYFCRDLGEFIEIVPPQQRIDDQWYRGTADAVYQNIYSIERQRPELIVILAGDHLYKMDYGRMIDAHRAKNADVTIGALRVTINEARSFGVMEVDEHNRLRRFDEKPADPRPSPDDPNVCLASMGIYVFSADFLFERLCADATDPDSSHDFGKNILPGAIDNANVFAFPFTDENGKASAYWRDVGTLEAYYEANMDLIDIDPQLNLYDTAWPIRSYRSGRPPAKFVFGSENHSTRRGEAIDSIVCEGAILAGGQAMRSIIGPGARLRSYARVDECILFDDVEIGRHSRLRRAILDKGVRIPPDSEIGYNAEADRAAGYTVTDSGLVVIAKEHFAAVGETTEWFE